MIELFNTIIFEPLFNALIFTYKLIPDLGLAIIILTVLIKLVLLWPSRSSIVAQKKLQEMQPKLQELQKKYKDNKEELGRQTMKFYKEHKINPLSSCLPLLIQLPILIGLYQVFLSVAKTDPATGLLATSQIEHLYGFLSETFKTTSINHMFLGFIDLSALNNWYLAILAGAAQFWQSKMLMSKQPPKVKGAGDESMAAAMSKQMTYFFPIMIIFFSLRFPAGLAVYWLVSTLFTIAQQQLLFRKKKDSESVQPALPPASPSA